MDMSRPYTCVAPTLEGEVLVTLARTTHPLTGSAVARLVRRGTRPGVQRALHRLVAHGLVHGQEAGRSVLYALNREHLAFPAVDTLAGLRAQFVQRLRDTITGWKVQPLHASAFGSAARGDGGIESDVDLFVVRPAKVQEEEPTWRAQLADLSRAIRRWTGNDVGLVEVAARDIGRMKRERSSILDELKGDAVLLAGRPTNQLLGGRG